MNGSDLRKQLHQLQKQGKNWIVYPLGDPDQIQAFKIYGYEAYEAITHQEYLKRKNEEYLDYLDWEGLSSTDLSFSEWLNGEEFDDLYAKISDLLNSDL